MARPLPTIPGIVAVIAAVILLRHAVRVYIFIGEKYSSRGSSAGGGALHGSVPVSYGSVRGARAGTSHGHHLSRKPSPSHSTGRQPPAASFDLQLTTGVTQGSSRRHGNKNGIVSGLAGKKGWRGFGVGAGPLTPLCHSNPDWNRRSTCDKYPGSLVGPVKVSLHSPSRNFEKAAFKNLNVGGAFCPASCKPVQRVALIVPLKNRQAHLKLFLSHIHPFLQRQQLAYKIFVIDQVFPVIFNRATLLNIGYLEASTERRFDCYIFHDVDLLPEHDHNLYVCDINKPRHLVVQVNHKLFFSLRHPRVGGVCAMTQGQMHAVNGFSNTFWGWGGEDDDMYLRITKYQKLALDRPHPTLGRYTMIPHAGDEANPPNPYRTKGSSYRGTKYASDGLNSLSYKVMDRKSYIGYTHIKVNITVT